MILFALGTEVDAVKMYKSIIRNAPKEQRKLLKHILREELDHVKELYSILDKDEKARAKQIIREILLEKYPSDKISHIDYGVPGMKKGVHAMLGKVSKAPKKTTVGPGGNHGMKKKAAPAKASAHALAKTPKRGKLGFSLVEAALLGGGAAAAAHHAAKKRKEH